MKQVIITEVMEGTKFVYKGENYTLTKADYPFPEAKNENDGKDYLFGNFEQVEVPEETKTYKYYFEKTNKRTYQLKRKED